MNTEQMTRRVRKGEIQAMLSHIDHQRDPELSLRTDQNAYILEDGKVLLVPDELDDEDNEALIGTLWASKDFLLSTLNKPRKKGPIHILDGRLPHGQHFPEAVQSLIDGLSSRLQLPRSFFSYSQESILELDKVIRTRFAPEERIEATVFAGVVAYVSETVRRVTGGRWDMRRPSWTGSGATDIWEPWIVAPSGEEYAPFTIVFQELYDHSDQIGSLLAAIPHADC